MPFRTFRPSARAALATVLLTYAAALAGCDLFDDGPHTIHGVVLNDATGEPIEGIYVELEFPERDDLVGLIIVTKTDGRFYYGQDPEGEIPNAQPFDPTSDQSLDVNVQDQHVRYNPAYSSASRLIEAGRSYDFTIRLRPVTP